MSKCKHKPNTLYWVRPKALSAWWRGVHVCRPEFSRVKTPEHSQLVKLILRPVLETPGVGEAPVDDTGSGPLPS